MTGARIPRGQRLLLAGMAGLFPVHQRFQHVLRRLLEALTEELGISIAGFGSMTFKRRRNLRGVEPDECYWITSEPQVRGKDRIDLRVDPPPDLVFETDWLSSSLNRMGIYAILGVPEVWRHDGTALTFQVRQPDGEYAMAAVSRAFPFLTPPDLEGFVALRGQMDENALVRQFRAEVKRRWGGGRP